MYDFIKNDLPDDERIPYKVIRRWVLGTFYKVCQSKIISINRGRDGWSEWERELAYACHEVEALYQRPIEILMLGTITLILDIGDSSSVFSEHQFSIIKEVLEQNDMSQEIADLPEFERKEFTSDLALLRRHPRIDDELRAYIREDGQIEMKIKSQVPVSNSICSQEGLVKKFLRRLLQALG